ncbi:MAG: pilus assembly protein, partial [Methylococcales bacterium]
MNCNSKIFSCLISALFSGLLMVSAQARSTPLSLSQVPLVLGGSVDPNIMFLLDDSVSMQWEFMPDSMTMAHFVYPSRNGTYGGPGDTNIVTDFYPNNPNDPDSINTIRSRSSVNNVLYYDRAVRYLPWLRSDGSLFPDASITCAPHNPFDPAQGCRNLTVDNTESATWVAPNGNLATFTQTFWPAIFYFFDGGNPQDPLSYAYDEIRPTNNQYVAAPSRTDCAAPFCTYQQEIQNFANWYTYYRSRILAARAAAGRAFANQGSRLRVGFASINQSSATIDGVTSPGALILGVRTFSGTDRNAFFDRLYGQPIPIAETPLRRALDDIGQYFERSDNPGPWGAVPGTNDPSAHLGCRQCYNVIMTDGYWNGANAPTPGAQANVDDQSGPAITHPTNTALNFQYQPGPPFRDDFGNTLADVAMYYWNRDLRTDLSNTVPASVADPAYWQHLVNFAVGLGVTGSLNPATDLPALSAGTLSWPDPLAAPANKIDDLWHTAVNSRGEFFTANNTAQFSNALSNTLNRISGRISSSAFLSLSSGTAGGNNFFYQAEFSSINWSGRLRALPINSNGSLGAAVWDAATAITQQTFVSGRRIITFDPAQGGIPFRFANLNSTQKTALDINPVSQVADGLGSQRLDYLRGNSSREQRNGGSFRNRPSVLGDIVNSNPVFVGRANNIFPDLWDDLTIVGDSPAENSVPFSGFRTTAATRQQILYFGANDGQLHGVDAGSFNTTSGTFSKGTGEEKLGYVPAILIDQLNRLTDVNYIHRYYVDATPTIGEAFYGQSWHTVLAGGLGGGGQAIFALDITDPAQFAESNAASLVLWEFSDANDPDLGNTYGQPVNIVRLHNGQWAAVFGNGYNNTAPDANASATGNAVLFIVDLQSGNLIRKIDTGQGMAQDPNGQNRPNGLSVP